MHTDIPTQTRTPTPLRLTSMVKSFAGDKEVPDTADSTADAGAEAARGVYRNKYKTCSSCDENGRSALGDSHVSKLQRGYEWGGVRRSWELVSVHALSLHTHTRM